MNVLVVAPHPDDESIGCGGAMRQHVLRGDRVVVVFLTSGEHALKHLSKEEAWTIREREADAAAETLGLAATRFLRGPDWFLDECAAQAVPKLAALLAEEQPDVVFVPHGRESHLDHRAAQQIYRDAAELIPGFAPSQLAYEIWTPMSRYNHLLDVTTSMADKLRAVRCYRSQLEAFRYDQAVRGLNRYRGALQTQWRYAEAFDNLTAISDAICTGLISNER